MNARVDPSVMAGAIGDARVVGAVDGKLIVCNAGAERGVGQVEQKGITLVPLSLNFKGGR
jgi:hypothetical protein